MPSPRLSATLLLVRDDPFEVLLIRRPAGGTFASALVFPGGAVEPEDGDGERALRVAAARETWEEVGIRVEPDSLHPFAHWITPAVQERRFDTHFYVGRMPENQVAQVDGIEALTAQWSSPGAMVDGHVSGDEVLLFPTVLNLMRLAESRTVDEVLTAAAARPHVIVQPVVVEVEGERAVQIPAEAGYRITDSRQVATVWRERLA